MQYLPPTSFTSMLAAYFVIFMCVFVCELVSFSAETPQIPLSNTENVTSWMLTGSTFSSCCLSVSIILNNRTKQQKNGESNAANQIQFTAVVLRDTTDLHLSWLYLHAGVYVGKMCFGECGWTNRQAQLLALLDEMVKNDQRRDLFEHTHHGWTAAAAQS